jgi:L-fuconolactonase
MAAIDRDVTTADLATMLDRTGADAAILVKSTNSAAETRRLLAGATTRIAGVVGWLDLTGDVAAQLDSMPPEHRSLLVGARHLVHIDPDPDWLGRADVGRGLTATGQAGLCVDLVVRWWQLALVETVVARHPEVRFVLDHLGGPPLAATSDLGAWERSMRHLGRRPNVSAKLSGIAVPPDWTGTLTTLCRPVFAVALEAFGPDRLLYGSDWPLVELSGGASRWRETVGELATGLSAAEREALFGSTAANVDRRS